MFGSILRRKKKGLNPLNPEDGKLITDFMVEACKWGVKHNMSHKMLASTLRAYADFIAREEYPLQDYVDFPNGWVIGPNGKRQFPS
jgi:hypothetical protein